MTRTVAIPHWSQIAVCRVAKTLPVIAVLLAGGCTDQNKVSPEVTHSIAVDALDQARKANSRAEDLEMQVTELERKVDDLESRVEELENRLGN